MKNYKKNLLIILSLTFIFGLPSNAAPGPGTITFTYNGFTYSVNTGPGAHVATLTGGTINDTDPLIIPDSAYDGNTSYPVTIVKKEAFTNYQGHKIVIGDNVTTINDKAFQNFGKSTSDCVLILGKSINAMGGGNNAFDNLGTTGSTSVFLNFENVPSGFSIYNNLKNVKNTTFYVKDYATYQKYTQLIYSFTWKNFDGAAPANHYSWQIPYTMTFDGTKWLTCVFPEALSQQSIIGHFGNGTKVATLSTASYEDMSYSLNFILTTSIQANTPYLIKIGNTTANYLSATAGDSTATTLTNSVPIDGRTGYYAKMIGVYSLRWLLSNEIYFRNNSDHSLSFYSAGVHTSFVDANKCYFKIVDGNGNITSAKVGYTLDESEITDIKTVNTFSERPKMLGIYNLFGQYLGTDTSVLASGIYIINGKKTIIR